MNRRMTPPQDGLVVGAIPGENSEGAAARVRILDAGRAELLVLPAHHTFTAEITIDRTAAGGLIVELLRLWTGVGHSLARLHAAEEAVEAARNSGDGQPTLAQIDELTEAVRQVVPSAEMAGGA